MFGHPILYARTGDSLSITPLKLDALKPGSEGGHDEQHLQEIIDRCPDVLAVREFLPSVRSVVSLGREVPVDLGGRLGYIDNLLVTDTGHLVIVETKLWRNPQALREVVAQVMHYGMALMALPVPALEEAIRKGDPKSASRLLPDESITRRMHEQSEAGDASSSFDDLLDRQTRSGEMLFLIVGDGVHQSVERFASWIEGFRALPFHLGLVELRFFSAPSVGTLIVPRTLLRTREVARHVVSVQLSAETASRVTVEMQDTMLQEGGGSVTSTTVIRPPGPITEAALLEKSRLEASPQGAQFLADLIKLAKEALMDFRQAPTELVLGVREPDGRFFSLLNLAATGLYTAQSANLHDTVGPEALKQHRQALNELGDFYSAEALAAIVRGSGRGCLVPRYDSLRGTAAQLVDELVRFREVILAVRGGTVTQGGDASSMDDASTAAAAPIA